jgi:hypothetical protein
VIERIRRPASDPAFSTMEGIASNRERFITDVHSCWKELQRHAINEILVGEDIVRRKNELRLPPDFFWFSGYVSQIWRRVLDSIVWWQFGLEGYVVRRLCAREPQRQLSECNPKAIIRLLDDFNRDPLHFALWADATTCVDVTDLLYWRWPEGCAFVEVKEGTVNHTISGLLKLSPDAPEFGDALDAFAQRYKKKGMKQLERVIRQGIRVDQVLEVLREDRGTDHVTGDPVVIATSQGSYGTYDARLSEVLNSRSERGELLCIEDCLWIYVVPAGMRPANEKALDAHFSDLIFRERPNLREWARNQFGEERLWPVARLDDNLRVPTALPLFFRELSIELIERVMLGDLMRRVLLYFDWVGFASIVERLGGQLTWTSKREGGTERTKPLRQRSLMIGGQVPVISVSSGKVVRGVGRFDSVLFEGLLPSSLAERYMEMLRHPLVDDKEVDDCT